MLGNTSYTLNIMLLVEHLCFITQQWLEAALINIYFLDEMSTCDVKEVVKNPHRNITQLCSSSSFTAHNFTTLVHSHSAARPHSQPQQAAASDVHYCPPPNSTWTKLTTIAGEHSGVFSS